MKMLRLVGFVLLIALLGSVSCDDDSEKSAECNIISFEVGGQAWQVTEGNIIFMFPKDEVETEMTPTIVISDKATISPESGVSQNFFKEGGITYTVTAENGTQKKYVARAQRIL